MNFSKKYLRKCILLSCVTPLFICHNTFADHNIERITILGNTDSERVITVESEIQHPDVADNLRNVAGANVNKNGALTGIVQYRGLYGDRIATKVGGQIITGAGPNAMDTPLSYSPTIITESINIQRGIASITSGIESLGGAANTLLKKAELSDTSKLQHSGIAHLSVQENGNFQGQALLMNIANNNVAAMAYVDRKEADDLDIADGRNIKPSAFEKIQSGIDVRTNINNSIYGLNYHYSDTQNAGTASLPMDIDYIFSHRAQLSGEHTFQSNQLNWQVGFMDADHAMDNFAQRSNMMPMMYRRNHAESEAFSYNVNWKSNNLSVGIEGYQSEHQSTITNPKNMMFNIQNFHDVEDKKHSIYSEWQHKINHHMVSFGARVKHISADAGLVSHHMSMMNPTVGDLVTAFNQSDRSQSDTNADFTIDWLLPETNNTQVLISLAQKQRAPSYQERYLWLPMEATAGLADGNTYLGNVALESETAKQLNIGLTYQEDKLTLSADAFYNRIDNYIQGTPNMNMPVSMFAKMMMNSDTVLQFSNIEAQLSGLDGQLSYDISDDWAVAATASYVLGKRKDIDDYLYRVAPLNGHIALSYFGDNWQLTTRFHAVSAQNKVSNINNEQTTAGYAYIDLVGHYKISNALTLHFGIKNLTDRDYRDHLGAYNRVKNTDIAPMSRLPSTARNAWLNASLNF